jgi:membrane-associated protein
MTLPAHLGYLALALLVGGESLGLLVPGETALLAAGILARGGSLELGLVLPLGAAAAIAGDNVAYLIGRRGGHLLLLAPGPFRERRRRMLRAGERFFARRGRRAVFLGRWVAVARVTVPWLAGTSRMPWRTFLVWNVLGGTTWVATVALAGYAFGTGAEAVFASTGAVLLALVVAGAILAAWRHRPRGT